MARRLHNLLLISKRILLERNCRQQRGGPRTRFYLLSFQNLEIGSKSIERGSITVISPCHARSTSTVSARKKSVTVLWGGRSSPPCSPSGPRRRRRPGRPRRRTLRRPRPRWSRSAAAAAPQRAAAAFARHANAAQGASALAHGVLHSAAAAVRHRSRTIASRASGHRPRQAISRLAGRRARIASSRPRCPHRRGAAVRARPLGGNENSGRENRHAGRSTDPP